MDPDYQYFHSKGSIVRVRPTLNPTTNLRYVFWSDLRVCFPGLVRIQQNDTFIPFMRCHREYRLRPLRIEHIPGVLLDVIYDDEVQPTKVIPPLETMSATGTAKDPQETLEITTPADSTLQTTIPSSESSTNDILSTQASDVEDDNSAVSSDSDEVDAEEISPSASDHQQPKDASHELELYDFPNMGKYLSDERERRLERIGTPDRPPSLAGNKTNGIKKRVDTTGAIKQKKDAKNSHIGMLNKALERALANAIMGGPPDGKPAVGVSTANTPIANLPTITAARKANAKVKGSKKGQALIKSGKASGSSGENNAQDDADPEKEKETEVAMAHFNVAKDGLIETTHLFQAFIQASAKGHLSVADKIGLQLNRQLEELETKLEMGSQLRPQFAQLCKVLMDTQQSLLLIREPLIQNRIQNILDFKVGIVDQLFPRLFIVLPKDGTTTNEFRVHFLCECHEDPDIPNTSGVPRNIHLTDHPGYDIEYEKEFLEKYCSYMLDFLNMLKYGVILEHMVVEPLDPSSELLVKVNKSMEFLMDLPPSEADEKDGSLAAVPTYLKGTVKESCLGYLYRVMTPQGHTSWICFSHYSELHHEPVITRFAEAYTGCASSYVDGHLGLVHVLIQDRAQADKFYTALEEDPPIHDLGIILDWDLTVNDLNKLQKTLQRSKVPSIRICLPRCEAPSDVLKQSKDAIVAYMLSNMNVQCFLFGDFTDQLWKFDLNTRLLIIRRALDMNHWRRDNVTVAIIVRDTHKFTKVSLFHRNIERGLETVKKHMGANFHRLTTLALDTGTEERALIDFRNGEMTSLDLRALWPTSNYLLLSSFIRKLQVTVALEQNYPELARIVKRNPGLVELDINCLMKNMAEVFTLTKKLAEGHPGLSQIRLRNDGTMLCWSDIDLADSSDMQLNAFECRGLDPLLKLVAPDLSYFIGQLNDAQAGIFERLTKVKGSQLIMLSLEISQLTQAGFDSIVRLIDQSPNLAKLEIKVWCRAGTKLDWGRIANFVAKVGKKNTALQLTGGNINPTLKYLGAKILDPASALPGLRTFELRGEGTLTKLSEKVVPWVVLVLSKLSLVNLMIRKLSIDGETWEHLIAALEFEKLESIDIQASNFGVKEMNLLVDRICALPPKAVAVRTNGSRGGQLLIENGLENGAPGGEAEEQVNGTALMTDGNEQREREDERMIALNDLSVHMTTKESAETIQRWEARLKTRTKDLLLHCDSDFS